ncbi:MAG: xanthine dehydrogenase family protein subunit M [Candidatus Hadarchaeum sp.]|uniref:FAD binding domain-containing protein n=1 Tax=Candidatus Hadarchaeum sp. TaxID=2883567 RepID=UPI00317E45C2
MPLPKFDYLKPKTVQEAVGMLAEHDGEARVLAGGTDLLVLMRDRAIRPRYLIDVKGIGELREISHGENGLRIGAAVVLNQLVESNVVKERFGALWDASRSLGDPILRNRATLVGNICNASPASDTAPALLVHGAEVEVANSAGERVIPVKDFFVGVKRTSLRPGDLVKAVRVPNPPEGSMSCYLKWGRTRGEDLAVVGVAGLVNPDQKMVRIALSSVAPTPLLIPEVEEVFWKGGTLAEQINKAASIVAGKISPISDVRASKEYRVHMAEVLTKRVLRQLWGVG